MNERKIICGISEPVGKRASDNANGGESRPPKSSAQCFNALPGPSNLGKCLLITDHDRSRVS
jgi:hypothetical protein